MEKKLLNEFLSLKPNEDYIWTAIKCNLFEMSS